MDDMYPKSRKCLKKRERKFLNLILFGITT